jgi:hypothetical protein
MFGQRWASPSQNSDSSWLESFIKKKLFFVIKKITICKVKFSLISITFILIEYIVLEGVFSRFSPQTFRRSWTINCASYWVCFILFYFVSVHFWSVYQYNIQGVPKVPPDKFFEYLHYFIWHYQLLFLMIDKYTKILFIRKKLQNHCSKISPLIEIQKI